MNVFLLGKCKRNYESLRYILDRKTNMLNVFSNETKLPLEQFSFHKPTLNLYKLIITFKFIRLRCLTSAFDFIKFDFLFTNDRSFKKLSEFGILQGISHKINQFGISFMNIASPSENLSLCSTFADGWFLVAASNVVPFDAIAVEVVDMGITHPGARSSLATARNAAGSFRRRRWRDPGRRYAAGTPCECGRACAG